MNAIFGYTMHVEYGCAFRSIGKTETITYVRSQRQVSVCHEHRPELIYLWALALRKFRGLPIGLWCFSVTSSSADLQLRV